MPEVSVDEFLEKAATERKPLSEEEKKEAMVVARKVWRAAIEKTNGKDFVLLKKETPNAHTYLNIDTHIDKNSPNRKEYPNTDLIISVYREIRDAKGQMNTVEMSVYSFSPEKVTKRTFSPDSDMTEYDKSYYSSKIIGSPEHDLAMSKYWQASKERSTQEVYHPDKADLTTLLQNLSSAKPI